MRLARLAAAAVLLGAGTGTAVALAADPSASPSTTEEPVVAARPPAVGAVTLAARGVRVVARQADPGDGPGWAVRTFTATERGQSLRCEQLGREQDGIFGWVVPGEGFAPVRTAYGDSPLSCDGRKPMRLLSPLIGSTSLLEDPADGVTSVSRSIAWGRLTPGAAAVHVDGRGTLRPQREQVVLDVRRGGRLSPSLTGETISVDGRRTRFGDEPGRSPLLPRRGATHPRPGSVRVAARAADPAGGPGWAVLGGLAADGSPCVSEPERLVGDELAVLGPEPGTALPAPFYPGEPTCSARRPADTRTPVRLDVAVFSTPDPTPQATSALRRLEGRTALVLRSAPDVLTVTVTTSRGVRTLVPDPRTHVALDLYDGTFPREPAVVTARLRSGGTRTVTQSLGG